MRLRGTEKTKKPSFEFGATDVSKERKNGDLGGSFYSKLAMRPRARNLRGADLAFDQGSQRLARTM